MGAMPDNFELPDKNHECHARCDIAGRHARTMLSPAQFMRGENLPEAVHVCVIQQVLKKVRRERASNAGPARVLTPLEHAGSLRGMKTISAQEAAERFGDYARQAHAGEKILVTLEGKPWVVLAPATAQERPAPSQQKTKWPDFAGRLAPHYPQVPPGPTATELLAEDKEDRF